MKWSATGYVERLSIRLTRWLIVLVAFGLMPLGIINYGVRQLTEDRWLRYVDSQAARLGTIMENAQKTHTPENFYYTVLAQLNDKLDAMDQNLEARRELAQRFTTRWRGVFDVFALDASGSLAFPPDLPGGISLFSLKKLAEALRELP
ncbi:MAG TPA: hypothetical protein PKO06_23375, partial [Candidatus Ozemobacteraceae bacterium]|nr:hypothetical protein [Candidatus Ozemobacteraceae bacterium]